MTPPSLPQLHQLPPTVERPVGDDDLDFNRHMSAIAIFTAQVRSVRAALAGVGVTEEYVAQRRMGTFAAEHHIRYFGELREGHQISTRVRFLQRTDKAVHAQSYLVDETRGHLACALEVVCLHVDQETRRATSFPDDVAAAIDARVAESDALDWSSPHELAFRTGKGHVGRTDA